MKRFRIIASEKDFVVGNIGIAKHDIVRILQKFMIFSAHSPINCSDEPSWLHEADTSIKSLDDSMGNKLAKD
jgi:hypothetical protein